MLERCYCRHRPSVVDIFYDHNIWHEQFAFPTLLLMDWLLARFMDFIFVHVNVKYNFMFQVDGAGRCHSMHNATTWLVCQPASQWASLLCHCIPWSEFEEYAFKDHAIREDDWSIKMDVRRVGRCCTGWPGPIVCMLRVWLSMFSQLIHLHIKVAAVVNKTAWYTSPNDGSSLATR